MSEDIYDLKLKSCIFCGKNEKEAVKLVGDEGNYICAECIETSHSLIHDLL